MASHPPLLSQVLPRAAVLAGALFAVLGATRAPTSAIRSDEEVVLFPSDAYRLADGGWALPIHGWIYEPEDDAVVRGMFIEALRSAVGADDPGLDGDIFRQRLALFLVDNERDKVVRVRVGDQLHAMSPSEDNGHFSGEIKLSNDEMRALSAGREFVDVEVAFEDPSRPPVRTRVRVLPDNGVSVISDIDDTIKHTMVLDKRELVRNTFLRPFVAAEGMVDLYRAWAREGVRFHFVSSSPWQLFAPLAAFVHEAGYPDASFALKRFRPKDASILDLFADPIETKPPTIERILSAFPRRRFCLVGDSGEKDPEVYGRVARAHPDQIIAIYIRNVSGETADDARFAEAFEGIARERWHLFDTPAGLPPCR